jgi:hypothetical protein
MHFRQRRRIDQRNAFGDWQQAKLRDRNELRVTAAAEQSANLIANVPLRNAGSHFHDLARDFEPQRVRCAGRRRIAAARLDEIGVIHAGGRDLYQHFAVARGGLFDIRQNQLYVGAVALNLNGFHLACFQELTCSTL